MKHIKVKFTGFYKNHRVEDDPIYKILCENFEVELSDDPEYLIYSVFDESHYRYDNCVKIFYTGENIVPDFNQCDYAIGYEHMTYGNRYYRCPDWVINYRSDADRMMIKHHNVKESIANKSGFCSFVVSNTLGDVMRTKLFHSISRYKQVDSGGRYLNNVGGPVADKVAFEMAHKFTISCENSAHSGYSTEKLVQGFAAKAVPIYWGDPDIDKIFNKKAFICVADYKSEDALLERIGYLDTHEQEYQQMLSEPALVDPDYVEKTMAGLEQFLVDIVDQPLEKALCRKTYWGELGRKRFMQLQQIEYNSIKQRWARFKQVIKKFLRIHK